MFKNKPLCENKAIILQMEAMRPVKSERVLSLFRCYLTDALAKSGDAEIRSAIEAI